VSAIPYNLVRSKRRTLALVVREDATLEVRAPHGYSVAQIENFIIEKRAWILRKCAEMRTRAPKKERHFCEGEYFPYLGRDYPMLFSPTAKEIYVGQVLVVPRRYAKNPRRAIERWYRNEADRIISARVSDLARKFGYRYSMIKINSAKRRWGSCNSMKSLAFSYRLVMAHRDLIDFVILHELCHTVHHNHSVSFYKELSLVLPDHRERQLRLKRLGGAYVL
jgi:predicted metal-dependent hydrolase